MSNVTSLDDRGEGRGVPCDVESEKALLSSMILSAEARRLAASACTQSDFYKPSHGELFAAILALHGDGLDHGMVDVRTVADLLRRRGWYDSLGGDAYLSHLVGLRAAMSSTPRYCRIIVEMAALRRLVEVCASTINDAMAVPVDVGAFIDGFRAAAFGVEIPNIETPPVPTLDEFCDVDDENPDWVIPMHLQRGERMVVVAAEGVGKAMLLRQMAVGAAQGIHPFSPDDTMPPQRVLLVDLENPAYIIRKTMMRMLARAYLSPVYDADRLRIWHEPSGIDLRSHADFARFDAACAEVRPDLVFVGPLYKLFRKQRNESDEDAALDVTARLDDLRIRHAFALAIEHHAPKGSRGEREIVPFGSAVWMRWPEFGPALYPHPDAKAGDRKHLAWGSWRAPRDQRPWPTEMRWGDAWPWKFTLPHGVEGHSHQPEEMF